MDELETEKDPSINENALLSSGELVMMQTATTDISYPTNGQIQNARMLLDSGSQRTYISEALARKLNLKRGEESEITVTTFGSEKPRKQPTTMTTIDIMLKGGGIININASIVPSICGTLTRRPLQYKSLQNWEYLWNEENLSDSSPTKRENTTIELLIGNDYYLDLILPRKVEIQSGLYMLASKLGWILTGRTTEQIEGSTEASALMLSYNPRKQSKSRKRSKSKERSKTGKRSKSKERSKIRKRSMSEERSKTRKRSKFKKRSKTRKRSKFKERSKTRKRSKPKERSKTRKRSMSEERSKTRKRSKSKERSKTRKMSEFKERSKTRKKSKFKERSKSRKRSKERSKKRKKSIKRSKSRKGKARKVKRYKRCTLRHRANWRLERITNLTKSWDNHIRAAKVVFPTNRVVSRPLTRLYNWNAHRSQIGTMVGQTMGIRVHQINQQMIIPDEDPQETLP